VNRPSPVRIVVAALTLSAAGFVGIIGSEGYTDNAVVPVKGDVPTFGFGSTTKEDGAKVRLGDKTTPTRALHLASDHVAQEEVVFRSSLPGVALAQGEYDLYMDWVYQYGTGAWTKSSMRSELLAGDYRGACDALLKYRFVGGYDCSTTVNGNRNTRCWGVWARQQERHEKCLAMQ
jgi:lysozyme